MKKSIFLASLLLGTVLLAGDKDDGLELLNDIRAKAGLNSFIYNSTVELASQNHADYLAESYVNNSRFDGHFELDSTQNSFTGYSASDRAVAAGYKYLYFSENLSAAQSDINSSVDGLMSAIYHRFGFLNFNVNEIGIGVNKDVDNFYIYNYNMANSYLNALCENATTDSLSSFYNYNDLCAEDLSKSDYKIEVSAQSSAMSYLTLNNPDYVYWPNGSELFTPVFFEESPDPLPNQSVSGNPISIEFNDEKYSAVTLNSFRVLDESEQELSNVLLMDSSNDPNYKFSEFQFALFPLDRLEWDSKYYVEVEYSAILKDSNTTQSDTISWSFITKATPYDYYKSSSISDSFEVEANKKYNIYLEPLNENDTAIGKQVYFLGYATVSSFEYHDGNTFELEVNGTVGQDVSLYTNAVFSDTELISYDRNITLVIGNSDSATSPKVWEDENSTSSDEFDYVQNLDAGWHLLGAIDDLSLDKLDEYLVVWIWEDSEWKLYSNLLDTTSYNYETFDSIKKAQGFWVYKE